MFEALTFAVQGVEAGGEFGFSGWQPSNEKSVTKSVVVLAKTRTGIAALLQPFYTQQAHKSLPPFAKQSETPCEVQRGLKPQTQGTSS